MLILKMIRNKTTAFISLQVSLLLTNYDKIHDQKIISKYNRSITQVSIKVQIKVEINL